MEIHVQPPIFANQVARARSGSFVLLPLKVLALEDQVEVARRLSVLRRLERKVPTCEKRCACVSAPPFYFSAGKLDAALLTMSSGALRRPGLNPRNLSTLNPIAPTSAINQIIMQGIDNAAASNRRRAPRTRLVAGIRTDSIRFFQATKRRCSVPPKTSFPHGSNLTRYEATQRRHKRYVPSAAHSTAPHSQEAFLRGATGLTKREDGPIARLCIPAASGTVGAD
ncbi:hypothetical protein FB451DRAFT_1181571 [Mycena latifolia]|nr:hypothetical protein FB451DRAFT_1181571 [Mycena latifolia]